MKAVEGYEATSIADEHHAACVQSLALVAYLSADSSADELLHKYGGRLDVAAIRHFAMAFLREEVDALERVLAENEVVFKDREIWRLLRHYENVLKRQLCLRFVCPSLQYFSYKSLWAENVYVFPFRGCNNCFVSRK